MKKIIDSPIEFVPDTLEGLYYAHPDEITFVDGSRKAMVKKHLKQGKVGIATGGGSGHLPLFLGYIGEGMLDGCSVGEVFQSSSAKDMLSVTKAIDTGAGVLYLYGNYGGDKMNFAMAAEQAGFEDNIRVCRVIGNDDVAVDKPENRRGIAGIFFVYKCAGAAAEEMMCLDEVYRIAQKACANVRTMGVSLSSCTLPRVGHPSFEIAEDEMEIGMGIHGEPGVRRGKLQTAKEISAELLEKILPELELTEGSEVSVLINGLGGTPLEEQYIVYRHVHEALAAKGVKVFHTYVGEFATSMEMAGLSISVFKLDDELKALLAKPANAICFKQFQLDTNKQYDADRPAEEITSAPVEQKTVEKVAKVHEQALDCDDFLKLFDAWTAMIEENKDYLVKLDSVGGDGDLGLAMSDGFNAAQKTLKARNFNDVGELLYAAGKTMSETASSSLGTLVAFGFIGAGKAVKGKSEIMPIELGTILEAFEEAVMHLGGAKVGDKTFLDGFDPAVKAVKAADSDTAVPAALHKAARAAKAGSDNTTNMLAKFGRIAVRGEGSRGILDPGSVLAALLIQTLADTFAPEV